MLNDTQEKVEKYIGQIVGPGMEEVLANGSWPEHHLAWYEYRVLHGMEINPVDILSLAKILRQTRNCTDKLSAALLLMLEMVAKDPTLDPKKYAATGEVVLAAVREYTALKNIKAGG